MSKAQDVIAQVVSYDLIAQEYYDPKRHPTCANFRDASRILLRRWLAPTPTQARICDVGAGRSLSAEILREERRSLGLLVLVDQSRPMLAYSEGWRGDGATLCVASASALPYSSEYFDVVASSLGDPYNLDSFWAEIHRVLKIGGKCFFTTPSYDWAQAFRSAPDSDSKHSSDFEL